MGRDETSEWANSWTGAPQADGRIGAYMRKLAATLSLDFPSNPFRGLSHRAFVASSARTGSHLLSEKLEHHGMVTKETFKLERVLQAAHRRRLISFCEYCERTISNPARGGAFGFKGGPGTLAPLFLSGEFPAFKNEWTWIYLTRDDVLKQAISRVIARKSGAFTSKRQGKPVAEDDYDREEITRAVLGHRKDYETWERLFEAFGVKPYRITYEQLASDPDGVAAAVAEAIGLEEPCAPRKPSEKPLQRQSSALNAAWEERFLREQPELDALRPGEA